MKAYVDSTKCSGYGTCADTCPSVFKLDEWGYAAALNDGLVPDGQDELARTAATGCPENAIRIED
ncbi:ferredoxin [Pseudonocardia acidicola]|uniref:Ferredoxin n=1 Tax=Pseudonocardia acidicola TaxID=2724939 RepID=A0ABX1SJU7_9PSEU|nr:ferredoxin [Pseudonocardia acidicola]NMI00652.1 ferredoxin [Pseudonocardia acidicola]